MVEKYVVNFSLVAMASFVALLLPTLLMVIALGNGSDGNVGADSVSSHLIKLCRIHVALTMGSAASGETQSTLRYNRHCAARIPKAHSTSLLAWERRRLKMRFSPSVRPA